MKLAELIQAMPKNEVIANNMIIAHSKINSPLYDSVMVSISGGADSDIVLDICAKVDRDNKCSYVWFDTGLEYQATKDHLKRLAEKYGIEITPYKAVKPIPTCCREFGQPFLSKQVSEWIERLQRHNFKWQDKPFEELLKEYPKCKAALRWWCNEWAKSGSESRFNIAYNKYLKEYMIENPPDFKVSNKCCYYAKKLVAHNAKEDSGCDLSVVGVRKAEGGARATAYKNCFSSNCGKADEYRPIFFYKKEDKQQYEEHYGIEHSDCYTKYGLERTGCAGCPYGRDFEQELEVIKTYEPKLYKAVNNIFGKSYEYTRKYREFAAKKRMEEREEG